MQRQESHDTTVTFHQKTALPVDEDMPIHELLERSVGGNGNIVGAQPLADLVTRQDLEDRLALHLAHGCILEEPANEADPEPVDEVAAQDLPDSEEDEEIADDPTDGSGDPGGPIRVMGHTPHDAPENAPTIQRKPRDEIEESQHQVDVGEVPEQREGGRQRAGRGL